MAALAAMSARTLAASAGDSPPPSSLAWSALFSSSSWVAFAVIYTATTPGALAWFGLMPVVPMTLIAALLMVVVSMVTPPVSASTLARY